MDFAVMCCPYCGRTVDSTYPDRYVCDSCGKFILKDRANATAFIRPSEIEDRFRSVFEAIEDGNEKKAMEVATDLVETVGNGDSHLVLGYVYALAGEDGKVLVSWKKGLELIGNAFNLDAYVCLMSSALSRMIHYKEREFIEFNVLSHIDRVADDLDESTGLSCKAFLYYSVYVVCRNDAARLAAEGEDEFYKDIFPLLFKRVVAYHRNPSGLISVIDEYLQSRNYDPETYDEDENEDLHVYDLIRRALSNDTAGMTDSDFVRMFDHWSDIDLQKESEPVLDDLLGKKKGLLQMIMKKDEGESDPETAVEDYVENMLLIEHQPDVEEPADGTPSEEESKDCERSEPVR